MVHYVGYEYVEMSHIRSDLTVFVHRCNYLGIRTIYNFQLTHIRLILKRELTGVSPAMEVGCPLAKEGTVRSSTLLRGSEPLEALLNDGRVFTVVVGVHLHV